MAPPTCPPGNRGSMVQVHSRVDGGVDSRFASGQSRLCRHDERMASTATDRHGVGVPANPGRCPGCRMTSKHSVQRTRRKSRNSRPSSVARSSGSSASTQLTDTNACARTYKPSPKGARVGECLTYCALFDHAIRHQQGLCIAQLQGRANVVSLGERLSALTSYRQGGSGTAGPELARC